MVYDTRFSSLDDESLDSEDLFGEDNTVNAVSDCIGCVALVVRNRESTGKVKRTSSHNYDMTKEILVIECKKGRGLILPGGKYESHDGVYHFAAMRELEEETGVIAIDEPKLIMASMDPTGFYCYCFKFEEHQYEDIYMAETSEGAPKWVTVNLLLDQENCIFLPYYWLLFHTDIDTGLEIQKQMHER